MRSWMNGSECVNECSFMYKEEEEKKFPYDFVLITVNSEFQKLSQEKQHKKYIKRWLTQKAFFYFKIHN